MPVNYYKYNIYFSMIQALSGEMSPAGHYGGIANSQPAAQFDHKDSAFVKSATAGFPKPV